MMYPNEAVLQVMFHGSCERGLGFETSTAPYHAESRPSGR
jgi:hypothetical protein